jgi:glycosyltransferase involved in cell wall biosynthesis
MNNIYRKVSHKLPLVSVIVPSFNHSKYVVTALESVINQSIEDWELIIIDDGSTDETHSRLAEHEVISRDPRISLHVQTNAGSHAAINRGMRMARGRFLAILNSDDVYAPTRLERMVAEADKQGEESFILTALRPIDADGEQLPESHWWCRMYNDILSRRVSSGCSCNPGQDDFNALLWGNFAITTSNFFISRNLWERLGPMRPMRYVLDWEYVLRVLLVAPGAFCFLSHEKLLDYRLHGANTILGGALRNHAEAYHMLRYFHRRASSLALPLTVDAVDRLHYLARFIRHEHARQQMERQKVGWVEQVEFLSRERDRLVEEGDRNREEVCRLNGELDSMYVERDHLREERDHLREERDHLREERDQSFALVQAIYRTTSWRLTAPMRSLSTFLRQRRRQFLNLIARYKRKTYREAGQSAYDLWLEAEKIYLDVRLGQLAERLGEWSARPTISVLMPVCNTSATMLREAVNSVRMQWYPDWELCICDDASQHRDTLDTLSELEGTDPRIRVVRRSSRGHIVRATNEALSIARGDFVCFLDHDDLLAPQALFRIAESLAGDRDVDLCYSDEDKIDGYGRRCLPLFKPDWSETLIWSQNYVGHLMCIRRSLLNELGGLTTGSEGSQDHDLVLRLAAKTTRVKHIAEVLYHWRIHPESTAAGTGAKPYAHDAGKAAVARHLAERYATQFEFVEDSEHAFVYFPRFRIPSPSLASIIIPTKDRVELLKGCIDSIVNVTTGSLSFEIIILDNGSKEVGTHAYFDTICIDNRIKIVPADFHFNWSKLNNVGRRHANGNLLVFLNNDTQVISPDWLQRLGEYALLPDTGVVGPLLLYPDQTVQHAGVVVGMGGWADHVFKGMSVSHYPSPFISMVVPRNVLAVTGACMVVSDRSFDQLGGFDESFEICGSDVDFCLRAHRKGMKNVYLPTVSLYHLESKTRSSHVPDGDFRQSATKYAPYRQEGDPFYNVNLDVMSPQPVPHFLRRHQAHNGSYPV